MRRAGKDGKSLVGGKRRTPHASGKQTLQRFNQAKAVLGLLGGSVVVTLSLRDRLRESAAIGVPEFPLAAVVVAGLFAAAFYGLLWSLAEKAFEYGFEAGAGRRHPRGTSAIVLSLCLTLPIGVVPFAFLLDGFRVLPLHWIAAATLLAGGAASHLLMYGLGAGRWRGLRQHTHERPTRRTMMSAFARESRFASAHFTLLIAPYRLITDWPPSWIGLVEIAVRIAVPGLAFLAIMMAFIGARYPASETEERWVHGRGLLAGVVLPLCLCIGLYAAMP